MRPQLAFATLILFLAPALAQNAPEPQQDQSAPAQVAAPASEQQQDQSTPAQQPVPPAEAQPQVQTQPEAQPQADQPGEPQYNRPAQPTNAAQLSVNGQETSIPDPEPRRALQVPTAVRPRVEASAYPVSHELKQFSIGAKLLSQKEVEQRFSTPLGKKYLVVEVGVFPADAQSVKLKTESFTLRAGNEDQAFFPALPQDIARGLAKSGGGSNNVRAYPTLGVGYENGPWGRGVSTGVGVGVGSGPYPRRGTMGNGNTRIMESELQDKSLTEGTLTEPVAGYLYFPLDGKRADHYNLELNRNGETISLALPEPKK
jgi:hypothetical protein